MRGKCERGRGKCERGRGSANADGAGAKAFAGDGYSQGASFGPMVAISRRGQGGRIYNNTRTRERLRRKCVKPAALTTHSPPKIFALPEPFLTPCPSTFSLPPRTLPLPHAAPTHTRRPHNTFSAESLLPPPTATRPPRALSHSPRSPDARPPTSQHSPPRIFALPEHFRPPPQPRRTPADPTTHSPSKTCSRPRTATRPARAFSHPLPAHFHSPRSDDARPPTSQHSPPRIFALPEHFLTPFPHTSAPPRSPDARPQAAPCIPRRPHNTFPTEDLRPPPQRRPASPSVPLRAQKNGTAQWMCDAECLGRPSLRSVIGVGEPRAVRRRCGALAWRVGLRPQPWALRSRRCGRVLRA